MSYSESRMIEAAKFRHTSDFRVYGRGSESLVPQKKLEDTLKGVKFSFLSSAGLARGDDAGAFIFNQAWRAVKSDTDIVLRYFQKIHDYFFNKKHIQFSHEGRTLKVTGCLNVNGEGVYTVLEVQSVQ